jgi:hypothetical protein
MNMFPLELIHHVSSFLDIGSLLRLRTTCRSLHRMLTPTAFCSVDFQDDSIARRIEAIENTKDLIHLIPLIKRVCAVIGYSERLIGRLIYLHVSTTSHALQVYRTQSELWTTTSLPGSMFLRSNSRE